MTPAWTSQPLFSTPTFTLNPHSQQPLRNHTPRYSSCAQPVGLVLPPLPFVVCCALYFYHLQQKSLQLSLQGKASQAPLMILITKSLAPGVLKGKLGDFPGGPEVVISPCIARRGVGGVFPGQGTKIPHAEQPKNQNTKQRQHFKQTKTLQMIHMKKNFF